MSDTHLLQVLRPQLDELRSKGLYKRERQIQTAQGAGIRVGGREVINFCANNYLGLANNPAIVAVPRCKSGRYRYRNGDMSELERMLREARNCRLRLIVTDGVFSMDGALAKRPDIYELADKYDAVVMVDDSHATGILGPNGRGTAEALGVQDRIDIFTSTLGKTLGGAAGGFTCARSEVVEYLRQRSRPYLFSNALPPPIVSAALKALELVERWRAARAAARQREEDAGGAGGGGVHAQAGQPPDPAGDDRRRGAGGADGGP